MNMKNIMMKSLATLLAVCLVLCGIPIGASAAIVDHGQCGNNAYWELDSNGLLTISGTGPMYDYDYEVHPLWMYCQDKVKKAVIEPGIISIGDYAFSSCNNMTSIIIPDSVTSIGKTAFKLCRSLTSITIPDGVTSIENSTFEACHSLVSITIPDSVRSIGLQAFEYCVSLPSISIPNGVTAIGSSAFSGCRSLTSFVIPGNITSIGEHTFSECDNLSSISLPDSVISIWHSAFQNCRALENVYYAGNKAKWDTISIDDHNDPLISATIHYGTSGGDVPGPDTPKITTKSLQTVPDGVVDVPYQAIIETTLGENISQSHELVIETGELPQGLLLEEDGELHGIPTQAGEYEFTVALKELDSQDIIDKRSYKVIVKESTPENVAEVNTSSQGYRLLDPLPDVIDFGKVESGTEFTFRSEGPFNQLDAVYIDGDELTRGVDYTATEGSCVIALNDMGYGGRTAGRHVISATFKQPSAQGNFTIKKTSQAVTFVNPKPRPVPKYSIKLDCSAGGAAVVSNKSVEAGKTVTITAKPSYGWEINQVTAGSAKVTRKGDKFTFTMPASAVTAKISFKRRSAAEGTDMPFFDVRTTDWFYKPVKEIYEAGLMTGTARNAFSPNHPALREMIATILYRHAGSPSVEGRCKFTDVKAGAYYEKAVIWAEQNEIISGISSTKFNPSGKITRQELVTLMYRYAGSPEGSGDLSTFTDIDKLSGWAENAASWAIETGIVTGKGNNRLDPQGNATRAEIATVLKRFIDLMELYEGMEIELSAQNLQMSIGDTQTIQLSTSKPVVCKPEWSVSTGDVVGIEPDGMSCKIEALTPGHVTVYAKVYGRTVQCVVDVDGLVEPDPDPDDGTDEPIPPDDYEPDPPTVSVNNQIMFASKENRTLSVTIPQTNDISLSWIPWDGCTGFIIPKEQADGSTLPNIELPCEGINLGEIATLVDSNTQSKTYEIVLEIFLSEWSSLIYTLSITVLN